MTDSTIEPSADDLATANEVISRKISADRTKAQAFVADPAFDSMLVAASTLRDTLLPGTQLFNHVHAIWIGATNLKNDVASPTA